MSDARRAYASSRHTFGPLVIGGAAFLLLRILPQPQAGSIAGLPSPCPFFHLTHLPCPLCGMTRSLVCTAHGDWSSAFWWHPLGPILLLCGAIWWLLTLFLVLYPARQQLFTTASSSLKWEAARHKINLWWAVILVLGAVWMARLMHWLPSPF
jgi:hypothetical protein